MAIYLINLSYPTPFSFLVVYLHFSPQTFPSQSSFYHQPFLLSVFSFLQSLCCLAVKRHNRGIEQEQTENSECPTSRNLGALIPPEY